MMRRKRCGGQSLIEVIISCGLVMIITIPIMAAALGGHQLTGNTSNRLQAAADARHLSEALKAYVVADTSIVVGPSGAAGAVNGWVLPGDSSGLYALAVGTHTLDPATWLPGLNGTISYTVATRQTPQGPQADVSFNVQWVDQ